MALAFATVADSIAALSVSGFRLKSTGGMPEDVTGLGPMIIPAPNFLTNFTPTRISYGGGSSALQDARYTLTFRLLFAPVGAGRGFNGVVTELVNGVGLFLDAVLAIDTIDGCEDITPDGVSNFGVVTDPAGNNYFGCDISLNILEFTD